MKHHLKADHSRDVFALWSQAVGEFKGNNGMVCLHRQMVKQCVWCLLQRVPLALA